MPSIQGVAEKEQLFSRTMTIEDLDPKKHLGVSAEDFERFRLIFYLPLLMEKSGFPLGAAFAHHWLWRGKGPYSLQRQIQPLEPNALKGVPKEDFGFDFNWFKGDPMFDGLLQEARETAEKKALSHLRSLKRYFEEGRTPNKTMLPVVKELDKLAVGKSVVIGDFLRYDNPSIYLGAVERDMKMELLKANGGKPGYGRFTVRPIMAALGSYGIRRYIRLKFSRPSEQVLEASVDAFGFRIREGFNFLDSWLQGLTMSQPLWFWNLEKGLVRLPTGEDRKGTYYLKNETFNLFARKVRKPYNSFGQHQLFCKDFDCWTPIEEFTQPKVALTIKLPENPTQ